jgi:dienelactone hydrolase
MRRDREAGNRPRRRERPAAVAAAVLVLAALLAACTGSSGPKPPAVSPANAARCRAGAKTGVPGAPAETAPGVSRLDVTLVDASRRTVGNDLDGRYPCRILPVEIRYPTGATAPLPLIVVAHGLDGSPTSLGPLLDAWSAAGYVVVAPTFPLTEKDDKGSTVPAVYVDQAADLRFVVDQIEDPARPGIPAQVRNLVDLGHIGVAGMSLGGQAVYGLLANTCCADHRVSAGIAMAAVFRQVPNGRYEPNHIPILLVQGDADRGYYNSLRAYPQLAAPKWFLTLHGEGHSPPFEVPLGPAAPLVRTATTDFWDLYLKHDPAAAGRTVTAVDGAGGTASLRQDLG